MRGVRAQEASAWLSSKKESAVEAEETGRVAAEDLVLVGPRKLAEEPAEAFARGAVRLGSGRGPVAARVHQAVGAPGVDDLAKDRGDVAMRILPGLGDRRELHD